MSLRTFTGGIAVLDSEAGAAAPSKLPNGYAVVVSPAAVSPSARAGRTVAAGSFPVWLVQTDGRGSERCRVLVTSSAPIYFSKGSGDAWFLAAASGATALQDLAYDVTVGDDPGDWIETASAAASPSSIVTQIVPNTGWPIDCLLRRPAGARALTCWTRFQTGGGGSPTADLFTIDSVTGVAVGGTKIATLGVPPASGSIGVPQEGILFTANQAAGTGLSQANPYPITAYGFALRFNVNQGSVQAPGVTVRAEWWT